MKNQKGFTLVELIIVIAVIGVLAAILIPVFANVIEKSNKSSALSDARNATETYIAEVTTGDGSTPPTLIIAVHKGSKVYTFVYAPGADEGVKMLEGVEKKYSAAHGIEACGMQIVTELESDGYIEADPNSYADPNGLLGSLGYDVSDGIYVEKDYVLVAGADISEATTADTSMNNVALPVRTPVAVRPTFDAVDEVYTFTITSSDITRNMAMPGETDPVTYGAALDFGPIIENCADNMVSQNWYGYDIKIINNSGSTISLSKVVINVSSGASNFVCAFIGADGDGDTDFSSFSSNISSGIALSSGDNEIAASNVAFALTNGNKVCGAFMLGYTGGGNPSADSCEAIAESTAKMYFKN